MQAARDSIHRGWKLLHHPLYGNYRPYQQPYRTLLLSGPDVPSVPSFASSASLSVDMQSLHLIEEALLVYSQSPVLTPDETPESMRRDCAAIDAELMRMTLEQEGFLFSCTGSFLQEYANPAGRSL